jgi:hypothetical protein
MVDIRLLLENRADIEERVELAAPGEEKRGGRQ